MMHTILQQKNPIVPYLCAFVGTMFIIGEFVNGKILNPQFYVSDANEWVYIIYNQPCRILLTKDKYIFLMGK